MRKSKSLVKRKSTRVQAEEKIKEQFEFFDASNNGTIELDELTAVFKKLNNKWTQDQISALMNAMDTNSDGRVSYSEFVDYIFKTAIGEKVLLTEEEVQEIKDRKAEEGVFDPQSSEDLLTQAVNAHYYRGPMKEKALELLDMKADPNMADTSGVTVLMHMAEKIDPPFAKLMISKGANACKHSNNLDCPIFIAASKQNTDLLRLFLMPDTTPVAPDETEEVEGSAESENIRDSSSQALVSEMERLTPSQIRDLVQKKADINYKCSKGWTPLTMAVFLDRKECVDTIIRVGALVHGSKLRIDLKNKQGRCPLHIAARKDLAEIMELLIKNSAKPDVRDFDGWTPLHHACFNGNSAAVRVLVDKGAEVDIKASNGFTPFQVTRLREKPGTLSADALELIKPPESVDFGKCLLPILKAEGLSPHEKIEELLSLRGVNGNMRRLRLHDHFFDPVAGPNKVKLQKVWTLLIQPLLRSLRTGDVGMAPLKADAGDEEKEEYLIERKRRLKQQKAFAQMWMEETKGPMPSIHWSHDNRGPYNDELRAFMDLELAHFKTELDGVYAKLREADGGQDLIDLPAEEVLDGSMLTQLGAHPPIEWLEKLDIAEAFEQLRLVGAVAGKEDDLAAQAFAEMLTYEPQFLSGMPFWKNAYRKWLECYAKMADFEFHRKLGSLVEKFNTEHEGEDLKAAYAKGPLKTYERMIVDEKDRGLTSSAETFEGRTVSASCLDMIRGTISVDSPQEILALLDHFRSLDESLDKLKLVQLKNFFNEAAEGMDGFRYLELNVLFKCGLRSGVSDRPGKSIMVSLVGEVQIVLNDYVAVKQRRSLQYKLWRGFFDWIAADDDDDKEEDVLDETSSKRLRLRGNKALYEDDS